MDEFIKLYKIAIAIAGKLLDWRALTNVLTNLKSMGKGEVNCGMKSHRLITSDTNLTTIACDALPNDDWNKTIRKRGTQLLLSKDI